MITPYLAQQPVDDYSQRFADLKYSATLAATTDTTFTVPGAAQRYKALIKTQGTGNLWVSINGTAAVPAGASFAATTSELIQNGQKICREVRAGDILHFFSSAASQAVSIVLYASGTNN